VTAVSDWVEPGRSCLKLQSPCGRGRYEYVRWSSFWAVFVDGVHVYSSDTEANAQRYLQGRGIAGPFVFQPME